MRELDGLKRDPRSAGKEARDATHFLAKAAQDQRFSRGVQHPSGPLAQEGSHGQAALPTYRYPLVVQQSRQAPPRRHEQDVDDALIELCLDLQTESGLPVMFCSNDTNARVRAEVQGVRTFDLDTVLKCDSASSRRSPKGDPESFDNAASAQDAPQMLLDQWVAQLGLPDYLASEPRDTATLQNATLSSAISSSEVGDESMELDDALPEEAAGPSLPPATAPTEFDLNPYTEPPSSPPRKRSHRSERPRASQGSSSSAATSRGLGLAASIHARPAPKSTASSSRRTEAESLPSRTQAEYLMSTSRTPSTARDRAAPYAAAARSHRGDAALSDAAGAGLRDGVGPARSRAEAGRSTSDSIWATSRSGKSR